MKKPPSQKELAAHLGVSVRTIYNWRRDGQVESAKIGGTIRITKVHVDRDRPGRTAAA